MHFLFEAFIYQIVYRCQYWREFIEQLVIIVQQSFLGHFVSDPPLISRDATVESVGCFHTIYCIYFEVKHIERYSLSGAQDNKRRASGTSNDHIHEYRR